MAKNIVRRNTLFPRNLKIDNMYLKHGYKYKNDMDKISMHFATVSCSFYILLEQLPSYIIEATKIYQEQSGEIHSGAKEPHISAKSIDELEKKIKNLYKAYVEEFGNIEQKRKIAVSFSNSNFKDGKSLSIGIKYTTFLEKTYSKDDGSLDKIVNIDENCSCDSELKSIDGEIFDYSEELENNIINIQIKLYDNMKMFINMLGSGTNFLKAIKEHNLLENKNG